MSPAFRRAIAHLLRPEPRSTVFPTLSPVMAPVARDRYSMTSCSDIRRSIVRAVRAMYASAFRTAPAVGCDASFESIFRYSVSITATVIQRPESRSRSSRNGRLKSAFVRRTRWDTGVLAARSGRSFDRVRMTSSTARSCESSSLRRSRSAARRPMYFPKSSPTLNEASTGRTCGVSVTPALYTRYTYSVHRSDILDSISELSL